MTAQHYLTGRLGPIFDACRAEGRAALIGYLPTGYPDVPTSIDAMVAMSRNQCDIIEVGVPYSDPGMDGPVIATATDNALHAGVRVSDTLRAVEAISAAGGNAVVMTYWNPVLHYGVDAFARDLAAAGGLGMITPGSHPGRGRGVAGGLGPPRSGPYFPGCPVVNPRETGADSGGFPRICLRGVDHGRDGRA